MKKTKKILLIGILVNACVALLWPNSVLSIKMSNTFKDKNTTYMMKEINAVCSQNINAKVVDYYNDNLILAYENSNVAPFVEYYKYKNGTCSSLTTEELIAYKNDNVSVHYEVDENYNINKIVEKNIKNFLLSASGTIYDGTKNYYRCSGQSCDVVSPSTAEDIDNYYIMVNATSPESTEIDANEDYYEITQYLNQNNLIISKVNNPSATNIGNYYLIANNEDEYMISTKITDIDRDIFEPIFNGNFGYPISNGVQTFIDVYDYTSGESTYYDLNGNVIDSIKEEGKSVANITFWDNSLIVVIYFDNETGEYSHTSFLNSKYEEIFRSVDFDAVFPVSYDEDKSLMIFGKNNYSNNNIKYYTLQAFKEKSNEFKSILDKDGNLVINSIPPKDEEDSQYIINEYVSIKYSNDDHFVGVVDCNDDFTECAILLSDQIWGDGETHIVPIKYEYSNNVKTIFNSYINAIPENLRYFSIKDMELMNYWVNGKDSIDNLANYSSELRSYFDYKNFDIDLRQGGFEHFHTYASGIANFVYNNTIYGIRDNTGIEAYHIMYVPNNTESTKEALRAAIQKRADDYFGDGKVEIIAGGQSIIEYENDYYDNEIANYRELLATEEAKPEEEQSYSELMQYRSQIQNYIGYKENFISSYNDPDGENHFLNDAEGDWYFVAKIGNIEYLFIVMKDSSKMINPKLITSDIETDVTISSTGSLPLDTLINANKLTSGSDYNKIIRLTSEDGEVFDLKLYSNSLDQYITKIDDKTFEVKIPVPEKFKDKKLTIYYVDDNDKITEYEVTVIDGYATFITDHFSIYTLAPINSSQNPKTGDSIFISIVFGSISLIGLLVIWLYARKKLIKNN